MYFPLLYSQSTRQKAYISSPTMKATYKIQSEHTQSLQYMSIRQFFTWWNCTVAHNCHGKTKSHGTTNFTHGKTKLTHGKTKLTHGKTKFTHGKTKKTSWSAVGQRLVSGCYLHLKW